VKLSHLVSIAFLPLLYVFDFTISYYDKNNNHMNIVASIIKREINKIDKLHKN